ncbi:uncharacterized protein LOC102806064 [Saccoglossus kowalevskii]|uniref:Uncharacterized protein LOC102806064 n=1 Tax=Saccoglossus kowalevskii TaxID=10224 RepID=A0ABM0MR08_SACKO|nr:PREDICTED: uncharacterized protein LOC102806064 [Saccoglossus kowalevskii]
MIRKLEPDSLKIYDRILSEQLKSDFIELVPNDDTTIGNYLLHRSVKKDSESIPIRLVYDASATTNKNHPSLNQCLETGPPLLNSLTEILIRFRAISIALVADIEKAFLMIRLSESDRKFTKFLWLSNPSDIESSFVAYQFKSVLFGATCSPYILNVAIRALTNEYKDNPIALQLQRDIYVDDVISGCDNEAQAYSYYETSTSILATRSSNLRQWSTNNKYIHNIMTEENKANNKTSVSALGLRWNTMSDQLSIKTPDKPKFGHQTSRKDVVAYSVTVYDPIGMFAPIVVKDKLIIQSL